MEKEKHLGLRIDAETHKKLKSLAEFEGRSMNGEVLYLIRQAIMEFESKHGIKRWIDVERSTSGYAGCIDGVISVKGMI